MMQRNKNHNLTPKPQENVCIMTIYVSITNQILEYSSVDLYKGYWTVFLKSTTNLSRYCLTGLREE